jgi:hypothetical protein
MIKYLTLLALKRFNRSLKSELTNIMTFDFPDMFYEFPGRPETRSGRLSLPKPQVKRSVQVRQFAFSFNKTGTHRNIILRLFFASNFSACLVRCTFRLPVIRLPVFTAQRRTARASRATHLVERILAGAAHFPAGSRPRMFRFLASEKRRQPKKCTAPLLFLFNSAACLFPPAQLR